MILITGGCGVMGSRLTKRLLAEGLPVRILTIPGDAGVARLAGLKVDIRYGDICKPQELDGICAGVTTVFHLAAVIIAPSDALYETVNVLGTDNLLSQAKKEGVRHFIYVSSASCVYPKSTAYSRSKQQAEKSVAASGLPFTIVRPTLVYDKGSGGLEFDIFLKYLEKWPIVPFIGRGAALKRPVFVEDIIDGLVACAGMAPRNTLYNLSGGEAISIKNFARLCLKCLGKANRPVISIPVWLCRVLAWFCERSLKNPPLRWSVIAGIIQDANLDPAKAMRDLAYKPEKVTEQLPLCFPRSINK